jgi:hypothetical protein
MYYYIEPVNFYWTKTRNLKGGIHTDRENYYLALQPFPFPEKPAGPKLKDDLALTLSNDSVYMLDHFDTRYLEHDTVMQMLFLVNKRNLEAFIQFDVISARINMGESEGYRTYVFKLHKDAIRHQLDCFLKKNK